jgi:hypothetical protein
MGVTYWRNTRGYNLAVKHGLFEGYDHGDRRVIEDDLNEALESGSLEAALEVLDLADLPVSEELLADLSSRGA